MAALAHDLLPAHAAPRLRCLLLCDLANSTALIEKLGDARAAELIRHHDKLARELLQQYRGQEIDKTDGFLILFERPIQAVAFALAYQRALQQFSHETGEALRARVGIHVGEVLAWDNRPEDIAAGAKPVEVEGLAKAVAARLMALAKSGQILLSETGYSLASRARNELPDAERVQWRDHGRYRFKGVAAPMQVFEVGEPGIAPLAFPQSRGKAKRIVPWWRWKPLYAVALIIALSVPMYYSLQPKPAIAFAERDWVVLGHLQNRTGDSRFDDALDTAIRIGLEQSRHVNVVANLKNRDTLKLMRRDPDTRIDRDIGSEIAQRIGARAVLLPSLAEIGGRLRFTLELIDPRSGTTVYTQSVEGGNETDLLPAMDRALQAARLDLGESMKSIESSNTPLIAATAQNINALRAYSAAVAASAESRLKEARELVEHAIELDSEFAMAHSLRASLLMKAGQEREALAAAEHALSISGRLSDRERLFLEAATLYYQRSKKGLERWKLLGSMYPDEYRAFYFAAWSIHEQQNDTAEAKRLLSSALVPTNPRLSSAMYFAGALDLAEGRFGAALERFLVAQEGGVSGNVQLIGYAHLLSGDLEKARLAFQTRPASGAPYLDIDSRLAEVSLLIEQGAVGGAVERSLELAVLAKDAGLSSEFDYRLLAVSLDCALGKGELVGASREAQQLLGPKTGSPLADWRQNARILLLAGVLARCGDVAQAVELLEVADPGKEDNASRLTDNLLRIAMAEISVAENKPTLAIRLLHEHLDGREAYLLRAALLRAYIAAEDEDGVARELKWLAENRGRGIYEYAGTLTIAAPLSVAEWRVANRLSASSSLRKLGD